MVNIRQDLVSSSKYSIKCPYSMIPEFIVVHNTANDASANNEITYMKNNNNKVSFHYAVDDVEIVQGIPENRNAWHAGDGGSGQGNRKGIAIEICYSKLGGEKFDKAEENAAEFIASKLKEKGWGIEKVKKHQDFANKYCPHRTLDLGWDRFLNKIRNYLGQETEVENNNQGGEFDMPKVWKNGSTNETVYADTAFTKKIGLIYPYGKANCYGIVDGRYLVSYNIYENGKIVSRKAGFVLYDGGVK